jgi:uncharacterized protein YjbI with pentapeptide repeats
MIKIEIKTVFGDLLFTYEKENATIKDAVLEAIAKKINLRYADLSSADLRYADLRYANLSSADLRYANLRYANLSSADLRYADLSSADLRYADLSSADLRYANLRYANLSSADLRYANLRYADLTPIKNDLFIVLLHSLPEIKFLKKNIIEGKIDGSTYDGDCACLSGTLVNGAKITDGKQEKVVIKSIMSCRDSERPIERFFLGIEKGDTPETNQFSKLALEWITEFEGLLAMNFESEKSHA